MVHYKIFIKFKASKLVYAKLYLKKNQTDKYFGIFETYLSLLLLERTSRSALYLFICLFVFNVWMDCAKLWNKDNVRWSQNKGKNTRSLEWLKRVCTSFTTCTRNVFYWENIDGGSVFSLFSIMLNQDFKCLRLLPRYATPHHTTSYIFV